MKKNNLLILGAIAAGILLVSLVTAILSFTIESLGTTLGIVFTIITVIALIALIMVIVLVCRQDKMDKNSIHIIKARERQTMSPTCTIQISTEYLVKDKYTQEEADKTIKQLYSLHENDGFSLQDFELIKAKIESRIIDKKKDD